MAYQKHIVDKIARTSGNTLGIRLGKACVQKGVPVVEVANTFRRSRQCVYNWFFGIHDVDDDLRADVEEFLETL